MFLSILLCVQASKDYIADFNSISRRHWCTRDHQSLGTMGLPIPQCLGQGLWNLPNLSGNQSIDGTRSFFWGTRQERMPLKSERNEAGTDASKIRGTQKGTERSFSVPFPSKFDKTFAEISQISRNHPQYLYSTVYRMKNDAYLKNYLYKLISVKTTKGKN